MTSNTCRCLLGALAATLLFAEAAPAETSAATDTPANFTSFGFTREHQRAFREAGLYGPSASTDSCPAGDPVPYTNPTVPPGLTQPPGASLDQTTVAEGLTLRGVFCLSRPTVIYVHGWSQSGSAEDFVAPEQWQAAGFNTFIFLWHRDAYDPNSPDPPEQRIWNAAGAKFVSAYTGFFGSLGGAYSQEIRVVGHSLGTQMATYLAYQTTVGATLPPPRVELLDPYVGTETTLPADALFTPPPGAGPLLRNVYIESLRTLQSGSTALVDYSSITGRLFVPDLRAILPTQQMSGAWLSDLPPAVRLVNQHVQMIPYYFTGISQPRPNAPGPLSGFSPRTGTTEIRLRASRQYLQSSGLNSVDIGDDTYLPVPGFPERSPGR
jgi:pimeloyl-ACP methyl ester carboxylesterase